MVEVVVAMAVAWSAVLAGGVLFSARAEGAARGFTTREVLRWRRLHRKLRGVDGAVALAAAVRDVSSGAVPVVEVSSHWRLGGTALSSVLSDGRRLLLHALDGAQVRSFVAHWRAAGRPPIELVFVDQLWHAQVVGASPARCRGVRLTLA